MPNAPPLRHAGADPHSATLRVLAADLSLAEEHLLALADGDPQAASAIRRAMAEARHQVGVATTARARALEAERG